jgi:hypothetical protein
MNRRIMMLNLLLQGKTVWLKLPDHDNYFAELPIDAIDEFGGVNLDKNKDHHFEFYPHEYVYWAVSLKFVPMSKVYEFIDEEFQLR